MRIASGKYKGRQIDTPKGHRTHPMSDKVKTALFNILGPIDGLTVLDAYSGSGALAIEASSRGAAFVQAIEKDPSAYRIISDNLTKLHIDRMDIKATRANCATWSENNKDQKFDIVLADPPYDQLNIQTLEKLVRHLKSTSLMVLSHSGRETTPTVNGVVVVDNRFYGDAALSLYRIDQHSSK